jgi:hypothetical protein
MIRFTRDVWYHNFGPIVPSVSRLSRQQLKKCANWLSLGVYINLLSESYQTALLFFYNVIGVQAFILSTCDRFHLTYPT